MASCPISRRSISPATWSSPGTARHRACACPNGDWIPPDRAGLTICDATSAAFAQPLPFDKLDVVTFSWQKVLGGEAQHGMLVLSPRAVERLETLQARLAAAKALPHDERRQADRGPFRRRDDQHAVDALRRGLSRRARLGRFDRRPRRADRARRCQCRACSPNGSSAPTGSISSRAIRRRAPTPRSASSSSIRTCWRSTAKAQAAFAKSLSDLLEAEGVAFDIAPHRDAPPGLRIWCGATVEPANLDGAAAVARLGFRHGQGRPAQGRLTVRRGSPAATRKAHCIAQPGGIAS